MTDVYGCWLKSKCSTRNWALQRTNLQPFPEDNPALLFSFWRLGHEQWDSGGVPGPSKKCFTKLHTDLPDPGLTFPTDVYADPRRPRTHLQSGKRESNSPSVISSSSAVFKAASVKAILRQLYQVPRPFSVFNCYYSLI
jgi:hypothetical protein